MRSLEMAAGKSAGSHFACKIGGAALRRIPAPPLL
jgi:hypothetical protein